LSGSQFVQRGKKFAMNISRGGCCAMPTAKLKTRKRCG
jgi:hypothetical protein